MIRRDHRARLLEACLLAFVACPLVCALSPLWSAQHDAMIALRDASPHILRPALDPTEVSLHT